MDKQDLIRIQGETSSTVGKNAKNDAVISFWDGSTLALGGVKKSEIGDTPYTLHELL